MGKETLAAGTVLINGQGESAGSGSELPAITGVRCLCTHLAYLRSRLNVALQEDHRLRATGASRISRPHLYHCDSLSVAQEDVLLADCTVREHIVFAARMRLPRRWSNAMIESFVDDVVEVLGLSDCADSLVGEPICAVSCRLLPMHFEVWAGESSSSWGCGWEMRAWSTGSFIVFNFLSATRLQAMLEVKAADVESQAASASAP